ncbi:hypothetical protein ACQGSH_29615 [Bacillus wiedmannii]
MEKRQQRGLFTVPGLLLAFCSYLLTSPSISNYHGCHGALTE